MVAYRPQQLTLYRVQLRVDVPEEKRRRSHDVAGVVSLVA